MLTVVGDFDSLQALQMVTQYFARVPKATQPVPRDIPKEPPQTQGAPRGRRGVVAAAGGRRRLPRDLRRAPRCVSAAHHLEDPVRRAERADSARADLQQAARADRVRQRQHHRGSESVLCRGHRAAGPDAGGGRAGAHRRVRQAEEASRCSATELQRAKNQFARDYIVGRESNQDKALHLAHAAVIHNDITTADGEFDIFTERHDRRRAARRQDLLHAPTTASSSTSCRKPEARDERAVWELGAWKWLVVGCWALGIVLCASMAHAQSSNWPTERPPRPLPPREVKFPPYEIRTLANGMQVLTILHHEQPAVTMRLLVARRCGAGSGGQGAARRAASAICSTRARPRAAAQQIADQIDFIGGALGTGSGTDLTFVNVVVMKDSFAFGDGSGGRRRPQSRVRAEEIDRQKRAGDLVAAGQRERPGLRRVGAVRSAGLRLPSLRAARAAARPRRWPASRRTICWRSTAATSCPTT